MSPLILVCYAEGDLVIRALFKLQIEQFGFIVLCYWAGLYTLKAPLSKQEYLLIRKNCKNNLTKREEG